MAILLELSPHLLAKFMMFAEMLSLFGQFTKRSVTTTPFTGMGNAPPPNVDPDAAAAAVGSMMVFFVCIGVFVLVMMVLQILFLLAMYQALNACDERNRTMQPGMVFLAFLPFVGFIFHIIHLFKIPESLNNEYRDRGLRGDGDYGKNMAIFYLVSYLVCALFTPIVMILYWMKLKKYTTELNSSPKGSRRSRSNDYDDEEDDRPRRKKRYRDDDEEDDD